MTAEFKQGVLHLKPTEGFQPSERDSIRVVHLDLKARTHHARELIKQKGNPSIIVKLPANCPLCKSSSENISEILEDAQWWWHCDECDNKWDPVPKTI